VRCCTCAGHSVVCKACSDGPGIARWKILFGSVIPEHVTGSAAACIHTNTSIEGRAAAKNQVCPGTRQGVNRFFLRSCGGGGADADAWCPGHGRVWQQQAGPSRRALLRHSNPLENVWGKRGATGPQQGVEWWAQKMSFGIWIDLCRGACSLPCSFQPNGWPGRAARRVTAAEPQVSLAD
jgi:hypothetical protein